MISFRYLYVTAYVGASITTKGDFNDEPMDDVCKNTTNISEKETAPEDNESKKYKLSDHQFFQLFFILDESFELHDVGNQPVATDICDSCEESAMSEQSRCKYDSI